MTPHEVERRLQTARRAHPLPASYDVEVYADVVCVGRATIALAGVSTQHEGECVTGSAASPRDCPVERAYMELLERVATVEAISGVGSLSVLDESGEQVGIAARREVFPSLAPDSSLSWSRSNGVAAGTSYADAAARAFAEVVERDRVLRSWFGGARPLGLPLPSDPVLRDLEDHYEFRAVELIDGADAPDALQVSGLLAFPRAGEPFAYGFAAARSLDAAIQRATAECMQGVGFLWGEDLPTAPPAVSPTPVFHQEYYLLRSHQQQLVRWLDGEHIRFNGLLPARTESGARRFVDLTPGWLGSGLRVVKALPVGHVPLAFGMGHPFLAGNVPSHLAVHPIA